MSTERERAGETFFGRWSRLKTKPEENAVPTPTAPAATASPDKGEAPKLPPLEELTIDSDFRDFLHPKVDEDVKRAALRKLFSDPHFNVMDGLDVYIDDYSKADPIPPEMLAALTQAKKIVAWAQGREENEEQQSGQPQHAAAAETLEDATAADTAAPKEAADTVRPVDTQN